MTAVTQARLTDGNKQDGQTTARQPTPLLLSHRHHKKRQRTPRDMHSKRLLGVPYLPPLLLSSSSSLGIQLRLLLLMAVYGHHADPHTPTSIRPQN
jgi:hypothetical protein